MTARHAALQRGGMGKPRFSARNLVLMGAVASVFAVYFVPIIIPFQPPDFALTDLDGNVHRLSDHRGKVVLLYFMATWCTSCRVQTARLMNIWEKYGSSLVLISISVDPAFDTPDVLRAYAESYQADWIWLSDTASIQRMYRVMEIPYTVVIDRQGWVKARHQGLVDEDVLSGEIEEAMSQGR